ncbi:toxin glutamine deamidase domain-containing protein [Nocardia sp. NPDC060259]|uniref:toxin glutamine deamidase domain-containing protein n=1 Tax=Nocardia sp. NPDC060259 TaxID=3347088 RepID=UPI0036642CD0
MGIEIPDELQWVAKYILGAGDWPEGDETAMRRVADGWTAMAQTLNTVDDNATVAFNAALTALSEGETHTTITVLRDKLLAGDAAAFTAVRKWCEKQAELLDDGANDIEHTKLVIIGTMIITAVELLAAGLTAWTGIGAAAGVAARVAAQVAVRVAIRQLIARMLTRGAAKAAARLALRGAAFEALEEGGTDLSARLIQVSNGDRSWQKFGLTDLGLATFGGAVGGAVGGVLGGGTNVLADGLSSTAGKLAGKVVGGSVTELGADVSAQVAAAGVGAAFLGQEFNLDIGLDTFTSAGAGGIQSTLESGANGGNATAPTVPELGTEAPAPTTPASTDAPSGDQPPTGTDNGTPDTPAAPSNGEPTTPASTGDPSSPTDGATSPQNTATGDPAPASPNDNGANGTPSPTDAPPASPNSDSAPDDGNPSPTPNPDTNGSLATPNTGDATPSSPNGNPDTGNSTPSSPENNGPTQTPAPADTSSPSPTTPVTPSPVDTTPTNGTPPVGDTTPTNPTPSTGDTTPPSNPTNGATPDTPTPGDTTPSPTNNPLDLPAQSPATNPDPANTPPAQQTPTSTTPNGVTQPESAPTTTPATPQTPSVTPTTPATPPVTTTPDTQPATSTTPGLSPTTTPSNPATTQTAPPDTTRPTSPETSTAAATTATPTSQTGTPTPATTPTTPPTTPTPPITQSPTATSAPSSPRSNTLTPTSSAPIPPRSTPTTPASQPNTPATAPNPPGTPTSTPTNQQDLGTSPTPPHSQNPNQTFGPNPTPTAGPNTHNPTNPPPHNQARALRESLRDLPSQDGRTTAVDANRSPFTQRPPAYRIRRFHLGGNQWVAVATIRAHIPNAHLLSPAELQQAMESIQATVDATFNNGSRLLSSGDRFLVDVEFATDPAAADTTLNPNQPQNTIANTLRDHIGLFPAPPGQSLSPNDMREISNDIARANTPTRLSDPADSRVVDHRRLADIENAAFQQRVEDSLRSGNGFVRGADPRTHPYGQSVNDGGRNVPGRGNNCLDCSLAALSSFFGLPRVSAPRWPDLQPNGQPDNMSGEWGGRERAAAWLGSNFGSYAGMPLPDQYQALHNYIASLGPGSAAIVGTMWHARDANGNKLYNQDGSPVLRGGHATVIVFPPGAAGPVWWDPQSGETFNAPPASLTDNAATMECIPLDANGEPPHAGTSTHQGTGQTFAGPSFRTEPGVQHPGGQTRLGMPADGDPGGTGPVGNGPGQLRDQQTYGSDHGTLEHGDAGDRGGIRPDNGSGPATTGLPGVSETATDTPDQDLRGPEHDRVPGTPDLPGNTERPGDHPGSRDHQESDPAPSDGPGLGGRDVMGVDAEPDNGDLARGGDDRGVADSSLLPPSDQTVTNSIDHSADSSPITPVSSPATGIPTSQFAAPVNEPQTELAANGKQPSPGSSRDLGAIPTTHPDGPSSSPTQSTTAPSAPVSSPQTSMLGSPQPAITDPDVTRQFAPGHLAPLENESYQQFLENALRDGESFTVGADPRTHPYGQYVNDGGTDVTGRDNNCLDCALSAISSFFGIPRISVPRWLDTLPDGTPDPDGEVDGDLRASEWLGRDWEEFSGLPISHQYSSLHDLINNLGPGSAALVGTFWHARDEAGNLRYEDDGSPVIESGHATVIVYPPGADGPVWWDPQTGETSDTPPSYLVDGAAEMIFIPIDANGGPTNAGAGTNAGTGQTIAGPAPRPGQDVVDDGEPARLGGSTDSSPGHENDGHRSARGRQEDGRDHTSPESAATNDREPIRSSDFERSRASGTESLPAGTPNQAPADQRGPGNGPVRDQSNVPRPAEQPRSNAPTPNSQESDQLPTHRQPVGDSSRLAAEPGPDDGSLADGGDVRPVDHSHATAATHAGATQAEAGPTRAEATASQRTREVEQIRNEGHPATAEPASHSSNDRVEATQAPAGEVDDRYDRDPRFSHHPGDIPETPTSSIPSHGRERSDNHVPGEGEVPGKPAGTSSESASDDLAREPSFNLVDPTAAEVSDLVELQRQARRAANVGWRTMGGALDFTIGDQAGTFTGFSGTSDVSRNAPAGTPLPPIAPPSQRNSIVPDLSEDEIRRNDAENNMLEHLYSQIREQYPLDENNQNHTPGRVRLFSEQEPCQSCNPTIREFQRMYPNIEIEVYYALPYPPVRRDRLTL